MMLCLQTGRVKTEWWDTIKMSKPCSKSKDQVRVRKQRNLVAKNNSHKGGYHSPSKYTRTNKYESDWARGLSVVNFNIDDMHYLEG